MIDVYQMPIISIDVLPRARLTRIHQVIFRAEGMWLKDSLAVVHKESFTRIFDREKRDMNGVRSFVLQAAGDKTLY